MNKNIFRFTGLTLIFAGLTSFFLNADRPFTALIGPFVGVIILFLSISIDKKKNPSYWLSLVLSGLFGFVCIKMAMDSYDMAESSTRFRRILVFWTMGLATTINAFYLLFIGFIKKS